MRPGPVVVVAGPRRPHELLLLVVGLLSTVGYLVGGPTNGSVVAVLPSWAVAAMYVLLGAGSAIGLIGCLMPRRVEYALGIEQGGLLIQAAGILVFAVTVLAHVGWRGWSFLIIMGGWLVANLWRAWQIQVAVRTLRRAGER